MWVLCANILDHWLLYLLDPYIHQPLVRHVLMSGVMPLDWVQILEHTQDNSQNQNLRVDLNHVPGNGQE